MIGEIKRHVSFLQTGDRVLPGVAAKFAEFHRWTLEQLQAETVREPRKENWKIRTEQRELKDTGKPLPPKLIRSDRYLALERLLVLLATIPRLEPTQRRERAQEIIEACTYLEVANDNTTQHDTKDDTPKNSKEKNWKPRRMTVHAVDCARRYLDDKGETPMKTVIDDYIEQTGIKSPTAKSLMRILNDNPDQWKERRHQDDV